MEMKVTGLILSYRGGGLRVRVWKIADSPVHEIGGINITGTGHIGAVILKNLLVPLAGLIEGILSRAPKNAGLAFDIIV